MAKHNRDKPLSAARAPKGVLPGRAFARTQGCRNCFHFVDGKPAVEFFNIAKKRDLATADAFAKVDPRGIQAPKVQQILRTTAQAEVAIKLGQFGLCSSKHAEAAGRKSDYVERTHLCAGWTAGTGASAERAGSGLDTLPQELEDKIS